MRHVRYLAFGVVLALALVPVTARTRGQDRGAMARVSARDVASLRQWDATIDRMIRSDQLRVRQVRDDTLMPGRTHERLDQYYKGVRVFGADVARQLDRRQTASVFGTVATGLDLDTTPALTPTDARHVVERATGARLGEEVSPELVIVRTDEGEYVLAYRVRVATRGDILVCFIDARTGQEVLRYSDLQTQSAPYIGSGTPAVGSGTGVYGDAKKMSALAGSPFRAYDALRPPYLGTHDMHGNVDRLEAIFNRTDRLTTSDLAADSDNVWTDGAVVDAHVYAGYTYDYYVKRFNRNGLDGKNSQMVIIVHPVNRSDFQAYYDAQDGGVIGTYSLHAFYAGGGWLVLGEGLPSGWYVRDAQDNRQTVTYWSAGIDVVAHEVTHGLTSYTSNLIYRNESGALDEAFSDIIGTAVEFFSQAPGTGFGKADYEGAEDVLVPGGDRSIREPWRTGNPDHYSQRYQGRNDNGGVHINSTIGSFAFYLAVEGGTDPTSGLSVQGVGGANRDQIEKAFYRGFCYMLTSSATFADARRATIQAAGELYGTGSAAARAITQAWTAVGVN